MKEFATKVSLIFIYCMFSKLYKLFHVECQGGVSSDVDTNCTIILGSLNIANPASE